ncbi:MAG: MoaD family protein [Deltaproteobacteria bacterium]|nr:MoaD family protein [Deltaproteobacteria bacterium]
MKIVVKSFLTVRKVMDGQASLEIEADEITIRELLDQLCSWFGENLKNMIFDPQAREENQGIKILINGRHYRQLPKGLDSSLMDGDVVSVFPIMAGG